MNLDHMLVFVKVIQTGSFSGAAKTLGMPVTTVSGKVASLEKSLGTSLIQRTTRRLNITEDGEIVYRRGLRALEELVAAEEELNSHRKEPSGVLRLTAPVDFAHNLLAPLFPEFLKLHPKINIDLVLTNRVVNLSAENIDLAIRVGELKDSSLIAKKIFDDEMGIWATPAYLKRSETISELTDLRDHPVIRYRFKTDEVHFHKSKDSVKLKLSSRVVADDMTLLKILTMNHQGIGLLPTSSCLAEVKAGKLVRVLPGAHWGRSKFSFVYPAQTFVPPKIKSFMDWMMLKIGK